MINKLKVWWGQDELVVHGLRGAFIFLAVITLFFVPAQLKGFDAGEQGRLISIAGLRSFLAHPTYLFSGVTSSILMKFGGVSGVRFISAGLVLASIMLITDAVELATGHRIAKWVARFFLILAVPGINLVAYSVMPVAEIIFLVCASIWAILRYKNDDGEGVNLAKLYLVFLAGLWAFIPWGVLISAGLVAWLGLKTFRSSGVDESVVGLDDQTGKRASNGEILNPALPGFSFFKGDFIALLVLGLFLVYFLMVIVLSGEGRSKLLPLSLKSSSPVGEYIKTIFGGYSWASPVFVLELAGLGLLLVARNIRIKFKLMMLAGLGAVLIFGIVLGRLTGLDLSILPILAFVLISTFGLANHLDIWLRVFPRNPYPRFAGEFMFGILALGLLLMGVSTRNSSAGLKNVGLERSKGNGISEMMLNYSAAGRSTCKIATTNPDIALLLNASNRGCKFDTVADINAVGVGDIVDANLLNGGDASKLMPVTSYLKDPVVEFYRVR